MVLLRNEPVDGRPVLPLSLAAGSTLAVLGELAGAVNLGDGGSSDVWALDVVTPLDGLVAALPGVTVATDDGTDPARAAAVAGTSDIALVVVGYTRADEGEFIGDSGTAHLGGLFPGADDPELVASYHEQISGQRHIKAPPHVVPRSGGVGFATGGDRASLHLKEHDVALIRAVAAANPRTVVTLVAGSTVVISEWEDSVPAVVQSWYSGLEGGHGLADVLLGRVDAGGRLPFSVPAHAADLPDFDAGSHAFTYDAWHGYWHLARQGVRPAYPFGFGLSYTTFELRGAEIDPNDGETLVRATLTNTGLRRGSDVLQVYGHRAGSDRPERLMGFQRAEVEPGASADIDIAIDLTALAERDVSAHVMVVRAGRYELRVARHFGDPGQLVELEVAGDRTT
jgi:beta-glucosidase